METRLQSTGRPRGRDSYFIVPAIIKIMAAAARSPPVRDVWEEPPKPLSLGQLKEVGISVADGHVTRQLRPESTDG